jgi:endonuclease III
VKKIDLKRVARSVPDRHGTTDTQEIGIRLRNSPAPLFQLLYSSLLLSARIPAENALQAAKALMEAGPHKMARATWQDHVDVVTWHGYKRYDERTSTMLGKTSALLIDKYDGDLRKLREKEDHNVKRKHQSLQQFSGTGRVGADIILREVQLVWDEAYPYADKRVLQAAPRLKLGTTLQALSKLLSHKDFARFVTGLIRIDLAKKHQEVLKAAA